MQTCEQALAVGQFLQAKEQTEFLSFHLTSKNVSCRERQTDVHQTMVP